MKASENNSKGIKVLYLLILCCINSIYLDARVDWTWSHAYGKEYWEVYPFIISADDGSFMIAGTSYELDYGYGHDIVLFKVYPSGSIAWKKVYREQNEEMIGCFKQTQDGGYIVAGKTDSYGAGGDDILVIKVDSSGNILWQKTYGGISYEMASSIDELEDGSYVIGGWTESFGAGDYDLWILRLDHTGNILWEKTYGGSGYERANSIQKTSDGNIIVAGFYSSQDETLRGAWVMKLDLNGNIIWQKLYSIYLFVDIYSLQETSDGGYIIAGEISFGSYEDIWVCKLDSYGNIIWQKAYGDLYTDIAEVIKQTADGGYIVNARREYLKGDGTDYDIWLVKLDSSGNITWQKSYYTLYWDFSYSIDFTNDGGYIIVAESSDIANSIYIHAWVFKIRENGTMDSSCNFIYDTNVTPYDTNVAVTESNIAPTPSSAIVSDSFLVTMDLDITDLLVCQSSGKPVLVSHKPIIDDSTGSTPNGIIEADEEVNLPGMLENTANVDATSVSGILTSSSPILITSGNIPYPDIPSKSIATSITPYSIIAPSATRPSTHFDITVSENPTCMNCMNFTYDFTYHIGSSFSDVPATSIFYAYVETLLHERIINGCIESTYCPLNSVSREQMAKFICRSMNQSIANCPVNTCSGIFNDVPSTNIFCQYIEALYNVGVVSGCQASPLSYCPLNLMDRQQMAKVLCIAFELDPSNPFCGVYPSCKGYFADVPTTNPFCFYIEGLYQLGIIHGCISSPLLYCPTHNVSREQLSKLLINVFGFSL